MDETLLMIGGPNDGALHSAKLGTVPDFSPTMGPDSGHYVRRKYLMPDDQTVLDCWVWTEGMRGLEMEAI